VGNSDPRAPRREATFSVFSLLGYHDVMPPLLEVENLCIRFGATEAVRGINFYLNDGDVLGLVGESGSGKSAAALAILGLLPPAATTAGRILWCSSDGAETLKDVLGNNQVAVNLLEQPASVLRKLRGREISMIFQEPMTALNPVMTIGRQVAEGVAAHAPSATAREIKRRAISALETVAIPEAAQRYDEYPHQFSGGQRQRILIAMALINRPRLLIADEPTTALDVTVQAQILDLLAELQRQYGLAMLFISHDLAVVGQVASRVAVMRAGQIVETGSVKGVLTRPQHPYTRDLLAAVPTLRTDRTQPLARVRAEEGSLRSP
jgi:peptide/nickel transport system ATP-binding protein